MCQGTQTHCRSCRRVEVRFYPSGRCGEVRPFPSWHTIRGHTRQIRRCHDCIQNHRRALVRAQEDRIRDARRAKSLGQYLRRERQHPLPDEESHLQSNEYFRLQTFDLISEDGEEVEAEAVADQDSTAQLSSQYGPDAEQHTLDINWEEYQAGRRLHPFTGLADYEELLFFRSVAQASPENATLPLLGDQLEECFARQAHIDVTGRSVSEQDQGYMFGYIRTNLDYQVAQLPVVYPEVLPEAAPTEAAEENEDYREPEAPDISFYDWTLRSYQQDSTHNEGLSNQDALEQDLDNYDWYLRHHCTDLQVSDFQRRRAEIATREFDFDHANLEGLPFLQWMLVENRVRARNGMTLFTCPIEALDAYCHEVIWECPLREVRKAFADARARHFEENRREFYGHARDQHCPLIERLRRVRASTLKMMSWAEEKFPQLVSVQMGLDEICIILTSRIAVEMEPTEEQWAQILEAGTQAVKEIKKAENAPPLREVNWRHLSARLTENWDHEFETQIGDVDDADGELHEALRVSTSFLGQEPQVDSDPGSDSSDPGVWLDFSSGKADPEFSSSEDQEE
ncbi:hypothetical protein V8E51_007042 [Hyaloscypha variabilis]